MSISWSLVLHSSPVASVTSSRFVDFPPSHRVNQFSAKRLFSAVTD